MKLQKKRLRTLTKKSIVIFWLFISLIISSFITIIYLYIYKTTTVNQKLNRSSVVKLSGLPDLAISTQTSYIRHRSLSDTFSQYKDDPILREYFPTTFTYSQRIPR
jgi:hypothetical protein